MERMRIFVLWMGSRAMRGANASQLPTLQSPTFFFGVVPSFGGVLPAIAHRRFLFYKNCNILKRLVILILLLRSAVHPNPGPHRDPITVLQWNCNGIRKNVDKLSSFLHENHVKVVCLQN